MKKLLIAFVPVLLFALMSACALFGSQITIGENERGVVADSQGNLDVLQPGTHVLSPFDGEPVIYPLTSQVYTMTGQPGIVGSVVGDDAVEALSKDGRQLWIDSAVAFRFIESKLTSVRRIWHYPENFVSSFIRPTTRAIIYNTAYQFNYEDAISSQRNEFEAAISRRLTEEFAKQGVELVKFSLLDVRGE